MSAKLSVSNIAWDSKDNLKVYALLNEFGIQGVEVAPTKIAPEWSLINKNSIQDFIEKISDYQLEVSALQALFYKTEGYNIFNDSFVLRQKMYDHFKRVCDIACQLGAYSLVFGAPKLRERGLLSEGVAESIALGVFSDLGDIASQYNCFLCIESNPEIYGCDFLNTNSKVTNFLAKLNHNFVRYHFDTACSELAGEDVVQFLSDCTTDIQHFHVSEYQLGELVCGSIDQESIAEVLAKKGYSNYISLEMREPEGGVRALRKSLEMFSEIYR